jgi:hypothetical protein
MDRAQATLRHALALHLQLGSDRGLSETHRALGELFLALGDLDEAWAQVERSLERAARVRSPHVLGKAHRAAARVLRALWSRGDRPDGAAEAERHAKESVSAFRVAGAASIPGEGEALRAALLC